MHDLFLLFVNRLRQPVKMETSGSKGPKIHHNQYNFKSVSIIREAPAATRRFASLGVRAGWPQLLLDYSVLTRTTIGVGLKTARKKASSFLCPA